MVLQNQIYFPNVDKCLFRLLLMKIREIVKVGVSSNSTTEDHGRWSQKSVENELARVQNIAGYIVSKLIKNFQNQKKLEGNGIAASYESYRIILLDFWTCFFGCIFFF